MYDGSVIHSTTPAVGFFLVPLVILVTLVSSLAPTLKKVEKNGLDKEPEPFGPFSVFAEQTNARASMVGLAALFVIEKFTGSSLF